MNIGKTRFERIRRVFENEHSTSGSGGQIDPVTPPNLTKNYNNYTNNNSNNNNRNNNINKSGNNPKKNENGSKDGKRETEEEKEPEASRLKFATASLQTRSRSIEREEGEVEVEVEVDEEEKESRGNSAWRSSATLRDSGSLDSGRNSVGGREASRVPSLGETERMILEEMTTATLKGDTTATKKKRMSQGGEALLKSDPEPSVDSSRKVLNEFLRDEMRTYADAELAHGTAGKATAPIRGQDASTKTAVDSERAERLRVDRDSAENPGIWGFSSEYYTKTVRMNDAFRPSQVERIDTKRETMTSSPAIYEKRKVSDVIHDYDAVARTPMPTSISKDFRREGASSSVSEERGEVTPSSTLYVKAAAPAWPFERGSEKIKGQQGAILRPMESGNNSPRVSFESTDSTAEDNTKPYEDDGGLKKAPRIEGELRTNRATVKDMKKWLMSGMKEIHNNYARPAVKYEDYFPNEGDSEYPYAIPIGRLSPRGKALRRRFEKVRLIPSASTNRKPAHPSRPKPSRQERLSHHKSRGHYRNVQWTSDREGQSPKKNGQTMPKSTFVKSKGSQDERKAQIKISTQKGLNDMNHHNHELIDLQHYEAQQQNYHNHGHLEAHQENHHNHGHPEAHQQNHHNHGHPEAQQENHHNHGHPEAHQQNYHNHGHPKMHHQSNDLHKANCQNHHNHEHDETYRVYYRLQDKINQKHGHHHNQGAKGGQVGFMNSNLISKMTNARNKNNSSDVSSTKNNEKKEAKHDGIGKIANDIETGLNGVTKLTYGDRVNRKNAEWNNRSEEAKEIQYTSSFLSRRPLDYRTVGQTQFDQYLRDWNDRLQRKFNKTDENCKEFIFPLGYAMQCRKKNNLLRKRSKRAPNIQVSHRRTVTLQLSDPQMTNGGKPTHLSLAGEIDDYPEMQRNQKKPSCAILNQTESNLRDSGQDVSSAMKGGNNSLGDVQRQHQQQHQKQQQRMESQALGTTAMRENRNVSNTATNNRASNPTYLRRNAVDLYSPLKGVERLDSKLRRLLPERQASMKTSAQMKSEKARKDNFFGVPIYRESVERRQSSSGGVNDGGSSTGMGSGGGSSGGMGSGGGSSGGMGSGGGSGGGMGSGGGIGGGSKTAVGAIEKKVSPIKRIKVRLSATVGNWRRKRDKETVKDVDKKVDGKPKTNESTLERATVDRKVVDHRIVNHQVIGQIKKETGESMGDAKDPKSKKKKKTMGEVKKELQRNIAEMEKTVTSLTRGSGKERVTAVEGTRKERRNSPERNIASKSSVEKNQSAEMVKGRKESVVGKTVTFSPQFEEGSLPLPSTKSMEPSKKSMELSKKSMELSKKSMEPSNRPRVETVRFVIERTLPVSEMEVLQEMMESLLPGTEVEKSNLPRIGMGEEQKTEVTERWICPPTTTTTTTTTEAWITNFLGDQTQAERSLGEMTDAEKLEREVNASMAHLVESSDMGDGSGDSFKRSDCLEQTSSGVKEPASPVIHSGSNLNSNCESVDQSRPASSLSGALEREIHIRRALSKVLSNNLGASLAFDASSSAAPSNNLGAILTIVGSRSVSPSKDVGAICTSDASRSATPSPILAAAEFPPRLNLSSVLKAGTQRGGKATSTLNHIDVGRIDSAGVNGIIGFPSVPTPAKKSSSGLSRFGSKSEAGNQRVPTPRFEDYSLISESQRPDESLESANFDMEALTRRLRTQKRQVVGIHVTDELILRTEDKTASTSFFKSISKFLFGGGDGDGLWQDIVSVLWSQRPQTATLERNLSTEDWKNSNSENQTPGPRFRDLIWPGSIAGRPTTEISGMFLEAESLETTTKTEEPSSFLPRVSRRPNTAPASEPRLNGRIRTAEDLKSSQSVIIGEDNRRITFFDAPEFGLDCRGLESDCSLVAAPSSGKLGIEIRASNVGMDPGERMKLEVARSQDTTNAINHLDANANIKHLNAINANGFRLIQKPDPSLDSAFAMTTEEINECRDNASEFERNLKKSMDMRPCPKEEFLEICSLVKAARDKEAALLEGKKKQKKKKKGENLKREGKKLKEIFKEASLLSICESPSPDRKKTIN